MTAEPASILPDRVRRSLRRWRRRGGAPSIVVAVSGGGDSVALLRAMHAVAPGLGIALSVAHLNHGVRGEQADRDERFVAELAEALGLPIDLGRWHPERPGHFEADARRARYGWLVAVAGRRGAGAVAVGHTRDDQAETVLHRIVRGTGPRGLAGIPRRRRLAEGLELIRPMLDASREEARAFLDALGQPWREDPSNDDRSRTRARIRHEILPVLAGLNPKVAEALVSLARSERETVALADERVVELARRVREDAEPGTIAFRRDRLAALPPGARAEVVRLAWRRLGWPEGGMSSARWRRIAALVRSDRGRHAIGAGIDLVLSADQARLVPAAGVPAPLPPPPASLPIPGKVRWGGLTITSALDPPPELPSDERIDRDAVDPFDDGSGPHLLIGPALPGDRFAPLGMGGKSMPVADFLRGRRVPPADRGLVPVVRDRRGLIWVVGHRIADRVRRTDQTRRILALLADPEGPGP
ncbi:tRNA lysidine(34) synthetase TilS [Tautonia sociabilis]|uniref:tRNA(Ile)-lysidine synthase n=1 Tax=Tautonia sociabilis TaxID=2080755 RepID=A0A432MNA8_9BACT|nr:tRNA lysidine(34) synthetase TilS [Tautonia sociabilis]RUL88677.1 tRNA lysidine(34) synthetase TilS [Tautonia sociabilis]